MAIATANLGMMIWEREESLAKSGHETILRTRPMVGRLAYELIRAGDLVFSFWPLDSI